jgi:hypothetical protein
MENTETPIQTEESTPIVPSVTVETPQTTNDITPVIIDEQSTPIINGEQSTIEPVVPVSVINGEPSTTTTTTEETSVTEKEGAIVPPTDEQENVTDTNTIVPPTCLSPGRVNIPLKEVNESENEEPALIPNGTENGISKKRELEQEDESTEETTNDNDERNGLDQSKKIKISDATDTPIIETKEPENNIIVNGTTAVEV